MLTAAFTSALQAYPQAVHRKSAWLLRDFLSTCPHAEQHLWAELTGLFYQAGATSPEDRGRFARRAVALVRRERATGPARTFAPGDEIPYDVSRVYDLDGDEWVRQGEPPDSLKDTWKMTGFNPAEHEWQAGGAYVTPALLDEYGPLTEIPERKREEGDG